MFVRQAEADDFSTVKSFDEWNSITEATIRAGECFVAGLEGAPLAFGILDRSFFKRRFVAMLYVHPDHRRRGFGEALLDHFESITTEKKIWISTNIENLAMQQMLQKRGFQLSGVVHGLASLPELVYSKPLSAH